ncbi:MAG TPA: ABC transporter permease [Caulobacteraceae bacterium]|jgi:capsular polysaccharide transport system permease protein
MTDLTAKQPAWKFQVRVIKALVLRDLSARYGQSRLGLLWFLLYPIITVLGLLLIFTVRSRMAPPNLPLMVFLITGYPFWIAFQGMWSDMARSSGASGGLLMFPQITLLDLIIARVVLEFCAQTAAMFVIVIGFMIFGGLELPADPWGVLLVYWACLWLGMGIGLVAGAIRRVLPVFEDLTSPIRRLGGFASGILHAAALTPVWLLPYFSWNPMFRAIDMARELWHPTYQSPVFSPGYVIACAVGLTAAGLVLERATRRYIAP